jgi:signal transduction histidine kinase
MPREVPSSERILVVAPLGADAANICAVLERQSLQAQACRNTLEAARSIADGAGALLLTEEALNQHHRELLKILESQPPWSDLPLIIIPSNRSVDRWASEAATILGPRANVTFVPRPLKAATLLATAKAALRARRRQYEIRDLLVERDALLGSLERRVQERTAKLQELVVELETFSYSVSHDLRAPLRVMAGYAQIILDDHARDLPAEVYNYVKRIAASAEKMDRLTQDVLAYTRLTRGEITLEPVNLDDAVREVIDQYPQLAHSHKSIQLKSPLGTVIAHGPSLQQALSNLIGNALKFSRPGVRPRVMIHSRTSRDRVRLGVRDNGIGIQSADLARIFRIFERASSQEVPGTGIGLALVKKAAERMSGRVGVRSKPGVGSEFWIELPAAQRGVRKGHKS